MSKTVLNRLILRNEYLKQEVKIASVMPLL